MGTDVNDFAPAGNGLRPRLQLSLTAIAALGTEMAGATGRRTFAAVTRAGGRRAVVTLHQAPPAGPEPLDVDSRIAQLRDLEHRVLDLPLASGDLDGRAWVVDAVSSLPAAADRLASGSMPVAEAVSAIRDLARALAAMHRRGIAHGAIDLDTVRISANSVRLGGTCRSLRDSPQHDLDALGQVAWSLLTGEVHQSSSQLLSHLRRGVPPSLDALCRAWLAADPALRPQRAEAVLDVLDSMPTRRIRAPGWIVDVGTRDGRPRPALPWLLVGAALLVLIVVLAIRG